MMPYVDEPVRDCPGGVVVGAAVLRHGRVLAARRRYPEPLAGGWEFPGGKIEAGETADTALVRECAEELGIRVHVAGRLDGEALLDGGWRLLILVAALAPDSAEPQPGREHDLLRWLRPEQLGEVSWLPADRGFLGAVREWLLDGVPLAGDHVGTPARPGADGAG